MKEKLMLLVTCLFIGIGLVNAQVSRVTGVVTSEEDGLPVVGASVVVKGTTVGTTTDMDGKFTLNNVPSSAKTLTISFIGMVKQEVAIKSHVTVVLQSDEQTLDDVVVIGYGSSKKAGTVVGSIANVGPAKIENKPVANVADALQGQVPGLSIFNNSGDPGDTSMSFNIRGLGSLGAGTTPLFVVDGTPCGSDILKMLNANDIANVTVLKDASATSIYGSRASNGVIYITTKSGKAGEKPTVQLGQTFGWSSLARRISNPMNANELLDWQLKYKIIDQAYYDKYKALGNDWDWQDYFFEKNAPMSQTNFSIRGGGNKVNYYTSASYYKEQGVAPAADYKRYTVRSNIEAQPLDWLRYGVNLNVTYDKRRKSKLMYQASNYTQGPIMGVEFYAPYWETPYNEDGSPKDVIPGLNAYSLYYIEEKQPTTYSDLQTNSSAFIELTPIKGLTLRSQLGVEAAETRGTATRLYSYNNTAGNKQQSFSRYSIFTMTNTAEYKFNVGEDHHFTLLAGQEGIKEEYYSFSAKRTGYTDDRLIMLNNGTDVELAGTTDSSYKYEFLSFFGRVDYALKDKYFANLTVRNDQSSRFGSANRSAWFISGGLMWDLKKENFLTDVDWLSHLQLRASVGSTGNASIGNYDWWALTSTNQYNGSTGWVVGNPGNDQLGWEKTVQTNFGVNATLFKRLRVDLNYYIRNTSNMLMSIPVQLTTGYSTNTENIGSMRNSGIELSLSGDVVKTNDLLVTLYANYAYNTNKITKLFYGLTEWPMEGYLISYNVGKTIDFYMPMYAGVDQADGRPMWYLKGHTGDLQHEFNAETMTKNYDQSSLSQDVGKKRYAPHVGGFGLNATYKGLTLNADFSYVLGKYIVNNDYIFANNPVTFGGKGYNQSRDVLNAWEKPGDITTEPAVNYQRRFDTHVLENASFMRLKNLSLSYDLPKRWMEATKLVRNFRVTLTGRNLFTVTKYRGADPEINSNLTYGAYPSTRQFSIGGEITF